MVFMHDSVRSAEIAREIDIDVGLHLNLTEPFASDLAPALARDSQKAVAGFLRTGKLAGLLFHPLLHRAFRIAVAAQLDEFRRLYARDPSHIDGHHHQHLNANVLFGGLLPAGALVRRHFTFYPGERSFLNRAYRGLSNRMLAVRCELLDGFFDLAQYMHTPKMQRLASAANSGDVELMVHPAQSAEFQFLNGTEFGQWLEGVELGEFRLLRNAPREADAHPEQT
jgi:predicted glycoside hydrolase/deacetylase ChbG (UPF0249 family)